MTLYVTEKTGENCYSTIYDAQQAVKSIIRNGLTDEITVQIKCNRYFLNTPIVFTSDDSGTENFPITYRGAVGAEITGALLLSNLNFESYAKKNGVFVAQLEPNLRIDGLIVNGTAQILARYPNFVEGVIPLGGATNEDDIKLRSIRYKNPNGGYIRALHKNRWGGNSYVITEKSPDSPLGLSINWVGDNNRGSEYAPDAVVVENIFEELDAPNEWFYDNESGLLYVYPDDKTDLNHATIEAVVNSELFNFHGTADSPVRYITLENLTFRDTKRTMFMVDTPDNHYVPLMRGDWAVVRKGAITLENTENIALLSSQYLRIGGNGIFANGYNKDTCIENNKFFDTGSSCIQIAGFPKAIHDPSFWEHDHYLNNPEYPIHQTNVKNPDKIGPKTEDYPRDILIAENEMSGIGIYEKQSSGINLSVCSCVKIIHNTIHNSARSCININDGAFGGHEIAWNDVFDSQRETTDHGPFNSWGRDRFWTVPEYNAYGLYGDLIRPYALLDAIKTNEIHHNRFHHCASAEHTWGIDLDDGSSNYTIHHNLCLGLGIKLREGFDRTIYNNIIIDGQLQIHCTYKQARDNICRNLVVHPIPWGFAGQTGGEETRISQGEYQSNDNWYYYPNAIVNLPVFWEKLKLDNNSIVGINPQFIDILNGDYTATDAESCNKIGFENFPMNKFGCTNSQSKSPIYDNFALRKLCHNVQKIEWMGAIITDIDDAIISSTASSGYDGVYFRQVASSSKAYNFGFREHDLLKELNGNAVKNSTFSDNITELKTAVIYRSGEFKKLTSL